MGFEKWDLQSTAPSDCVKRLILFVSIALHNSAFEVICQRIHISVFYGRQFSRAQS